jgi:hypothetical protein
VTVASVGDSRCILDTQGGAVTTLTVDHRLEENIEEYVNIDFLISKTESVTFSVLLMGMSFTVYTGGNVLLQVEVRLGGSALSVVLR